MGNRGSATLMFGAPLDRATLTDDDLRAAMTGSPMKRTGTKGLRRTLSAMGLDGPPDPPA